MAELGWTEDAKALLPGDPEQVWNTVRAFQAHAQNLEFVGQGLKTIDTAEWRGPTAEAFRACFDHHPTRWLNASDAFADAATALDAHAFTLQWAQSEAREAVALWHEGVAKTRAAAATNPALMFNAAASPIPSLVQASNEHPTSGDPGAELRASARSKLNRARQQVDESGHVAAAKVRAATEAAPAKPNLLERIAEFVSPASYYALWLSGAGTNVTVNMQDYKWPHVPLSEYKIDLQSVAGRDGEYSVGPQSADLITKGKPGMQATDLNGKLIIGGVSPVLNGTLTVHGNTWEFIGAASIPTGDTYNFDVRAFTPDSRGLVGESLTALGAAGGIVTAIGSRGMVVPYDYHVTIEGEIPMHETGKFK